MLTGDKVETAKCIAISTGLKSIKEGVYELKEMGTNFAELKQAILDFMPQRNHNMLLVDGSTLSYILASQELCNLFFKVANDAKSVCICRCSPLQKASVAQKVKQTTGKIVACIGDGGNDVAMI